MPGGVSRTLFYALPLGSVVATTLALDLIPVPGNLLPSFSGNAILLLYLLEVPALVDVLAGYGSRSLYGQVSAAREAILSLGYNLPLLAAIIALAVHAHSFTLSDMANAPLSPVQLVAGLAFLLAIPARLKSNPFSIPNAEQEIVAGAHIEYNATPLALFELSHALEIVAFVGLFCALFLSGLMNLLGLVAYLVASLVVVFIVTLIAVATARLKVNQAFRFYWSWGAAAAALAFVTALVW